MAQIVEYNGARIEFPDGMPPAEIEATIRRHALSLPGKKKETAPDPTEGMSAFERGAAGAGKAVVDLGRGVGQYVPVRRNGEWSTLVTRGDVEESRRLDSALMNTTGGQVGNLAGNLALLAPSAFIPGANTLAGAGVIGSVAGAVQPSTSTQETLSNSALGGLAAPGTMLAVRGGQAMYQGAKGLVEPLTKAGQERMAAEVIRRSATDPVRAAQAAAQARPLVPGSQPTLAQASMDPGLAQLERTILNNPEYAPALQQRYAGQRAARLQSVQEVAGTPDYYDAIKAGRQVFANEDYAKAMAQGIDQDMARAVQPQIESLMARPSMQKAQGMARWLASENGQTITNFGSLEGMDWLKKALDNQISKAAQPGSSIGKEELRALVQTKNDLMATLEQIAPGYKQANEAYAAMSRQVNSMDVARSLLDRLQRPGSEYAGGSAREMGDSYMRALSQAQDSVKKATGMNRGISDVMSTRDIAQLEGVARDLGRKAFVENAGRATGSNTVQNLASQNMLRRILGPTGLPETWAESVMLQSFLSPVQAASKLSGADRRVMDRIATSLLDPMEGVGLLSMRPQVRNVGLLGAPSTQRLLPAAGLLPLTTRDRQ